MKKTPALAGVLYARIPHGRLGAGGWKAPCTVDFEPDSFLRLYQTAHSESIVDKWDNLHSGRVGPQRERQARARPFSQRFALQRKGQCTLKLKGPAYCRAFLHSVIIDDGS